MEKNKLDSFSRMSPAMQEIIAFEEQQAEKLYQDPLLKTNQRALYAASREYWNQGAPAMEKSGNYRFSDGSLTVPFAVHHPINKKPGVILYIHGGAFSVGSPKTHEGIMRRLAAETGQAVAGIDYSLAPEATYPKAVLECVSLALHLQQQGERYDVDSRFITLAGDSAGAYLALAAALYMRDREPECRIHCLLLYYGAFGLSDSMSMRLYGGSWDGLSLADLRSAWAVFAGERAEEANLFSKDLTWGIPPSYILACDLDPFKDDSRLLHAILEENGIKAAYRETKGLIHGFLHYSARLPEAEEMIRDSTRFLQSLQA